MPALALPDKLSEAHALIEQLQWRVTQLEKQLYGPKSERVSLENYSQEQVLLSLFPPPAEPPALSEVVVDGPPEGKKELPSRKPRRNPALKELETVTERIEPEDRLCPHCGKEQCEIGCERSERFEYVPAKIIRHEIVRPKFACPCGKGTVSIAPLPPTPVEKGYPGPGLIAQVMLAKYDDHLPLYRQEQQFARLGVHFSRQMLSDWVEHGARWLQPVVRRMKADLLAGDYLQADETPVRVMDPEVKGRCATGYLWVMGRPKEDVIFEFHPGRGKEYARQLLGDYGGYLQCDGYGVYGSLDKERPGLKRCGCLAHARRKLVDALGAQRTHAEWFVLEVHKLYRIERHAREDAMTADQRHALRQQLAPPIWAGIKQRAEELRPTLLPQSPLGRR